MTTSVTFKDAERFVKKLGFEPSFVEKVELLPNGIRVLVHRKNHNGKKYVVGALADPSKPGDGIHKYRQEGDVIGELAKDWYELTYVGGVPTDIQEGS